MSDKVDLVSLIGGLPEKDREYVLDLLGRLPVDVRYIAELVVEKTERARAVHTPCTPGEAETAD